MKITVIGPSGGGKSTLTRKISDKFGIPRLEMDRLWFESGGHNCFIKGCTEEEKNMVSQRINKKVSEFLSTHEHWVIDGTYTKIQPLIANKADAVVLIRRPLPQRLFGHILRVIKNTDCHPETSKWQDIHFSKTIVRRWIKGENKKLDEFLVTYQDKLIILKSFKEIDDYLNSLA